MASMDPTNGTVLNSWKEIASHVGRGVRTVQRWERELGMPVRRPRAKSRSAVIAFPEEIDAWVKSAPTGKPVRHNTNHTTELIIDLQKAIELLKELCVRSRELRIESKDVRFALISKVEEIRKSVASQQSGMSIDSANKAPLLTRV
jgi:phage terminase Nu1 subunit (DNA packaging protein)